MDESAIEQRCVEFKELLRGDHDDRTIVESRLLGREPFIFDGKPEQYAALRRRIAQHFGIEIRATMMVGSGHLGFSIAPDKLWRPFNERSDIDMVIISERAFMDYWQRVSRHLEATQPTTENEARAFRDFKKFHFRGRISPQVPESG